MPSDIRSFFGGKPASASQEKPSTIKVEKPSKSKGRKARVVEESDEDEEPPKKATPKKPTAKKQPASPEGKPTTTSDYFGASNKPKRSETVKPIKSELDEKHVKSEDTPKKTPRGKTDKKVSVKSETPKRSTRTSTNGNTKHYNEDDFDDLDNDDDLFQADFKESKRGAKDDYEEESEPEKEERVVKRESRGRGRQPRIKDEDAFVPGEDDVDMKEIQPDDDFVEPDPDERIVIDKPAKTPTKAQTASRKRKSNDDDDDDDEGDGKSKSKKSTPVKRPRKSTKDDENKPESAEMQAILASIPTIRAPTPPPKDGTTGKYNFAQNAANKAPPPGAGTKEIPEGAENCLAGLSFVFTGQNETLGREEGQALVKRYGGKVMTAPSKKTSYVVLGSDAGPKKLETIQKFGLKAIDEDGFFALLRVMPANGGDGKAGEAYAAKKAEEQKKIEKAAAELDKEQKAADEAARAAKAARTYAAAGSSGPKPSGKAKVGPSVEDRLWTVKYAPTQLTQICGNKTQVEKLQTWLRAFPRNQRTGFKMPGKDGSGTFRAVIISGPPGIGKTTAAHLVAKIEGYDIVEMNASDTRSKKLMEEGLRGVLGTTSLLGYFAGDGKDVEVSKKKLVLIMDEVDGMSAGDRGGVGALAAVCKKTSIPMILICNDRKLPKMKPFDFVTYELPFRRPTIDQVRSRIMTIAFREGMKMPPNVIDALIEGSNKDIRQVVNMISSAKLDEEAMDFDRTKQMSKAWEKHIILKPWDITSKILGGGMFNPANKATLNDKIELYFNDHEFSYLMLQENYLGTKPELSNGYKDKERDLKILDLVSKAADSISDGDLVDRMIHGSQQQWSLMPTHAVFSFVRPASFIAGSMAGNQTRFTTWLGKNSAQGKFTRLVKEIQGHMRLRASADRHEIRQQYVPMLWRRLVDRLQEGGKEAVPEIIDLMDSYFLTRDDWDAIMELGVDSMNMENVKIESQSKATFTRLYNAQSHPLPFIKASTVAAPKKAAKEKPDLEEAIDDSDDEAAVAPEEDNKEAQADEEGDITKDKYIKAPKKKKAAASGGAAKGKGKAGGKKRAAEDDEDESDEEKPVAKKGRGSGAAGRGRGRGGKK